MNFNINTNDIFTQKADSLILPVWKNNLATQNIQIVEKNNDNLIKNLIENNAFDASIGNIFTLVNTKAVSASKVILVGLGEEADFKIESVKKLAESLSKQFFDAKDKKVIIDLSEITEKLNGKGFSYFVEMLSFYSYRFNDFKTVKVKNLTVTDIDLSVKSAFADDAKQALKQGLAVANGVKSARTIANYPPNICNAAFLASKAEKLSANFNKIKTTVYNEKALDELGMKTYLAVGRGSVNESMMSVMHYQGSADGHKAPIVLVGKGLTFDSGGISLKPGAGMDEMKYDMCGAATVYGVMKAIAELELPISVIGVMAGCENMPGSNAYRPGDILTTLSGQTVEVINTDAEGRLVLCDVLTFVERFNPKAVIDIATLTGACIVALGHHYTGVMGNEQTLINAILDASKSANDKAWQLPIDDAFDAQIDSTCADIVNAGGRDAGTITAGCFLSRFTKKYHWAHLDIAGTAWVSGANKGATGRPVSLLVEYLKSQA